MSTTRPGFLRRLEATIDAGWDLVNSIERHLGGPVSTMEAAARPTRGSRASSTKPGRPLAASHPSMPEGRGRGRPSQTKR
jgi:hypothetical protein